MRIVIWGGLLLIAVLTTPHLYTQWRTDHGIRDRIRDSVADLARSDADQANQSGHVEVVNVPRKFTEKRMHKIVAKSQGKPDSVFIWNWGGVRNATVSAMGLDYVHHFANSYLIGYQPFETDFVWVPLYTLTMRKHYEYDHLQYSGLGDVWQNSKQAYYYTRGDCEDHAMILADWLISMGLDARVAVGTYKGGGHAWVVFMRDGKTYLLEATSKRKSRGFESIPLANMKIDYRPKYQFNREKFWVNTGGRFAVGYTGSHWKLRSHFVPANGMAQ